MAEYQRSIKKVCGHCKREFIGFGQQKYCGKNCLEWSRRKTDRTRPARAIVIDGCKKCAGCGEMVTIENFRIVRDTRVNKEYRCHLCPNCERERARKGRSTEQGKAKRIEERKRAAEKAGRVYRPRQSLERTSLEKAYARIIERNARDAFDWWFSKKTDEQVKQWYEAMGKPWLNPRLTDAEKYRIQYRLDIDFQIHERIRRQIKKAETKDGVAELIRQALKRGGESNKVKKLLGYSIAELKTHIERQFRKGMSWEKFVSGEIHIDHIIPKKSFDMSDDNQWKQCWSLPNLRPLWARENLEKHCKVLNLL